MLRKVILLLVAFLVWLPGQAAAAQSYTADRFDVLVDVQADGSLLVTETVAFRFEGGPFTYAFRELELDQLDRVEIVSASMDGVDLPPGEGAGQVEIDTRGDPYEITWHFPPTTDRVRTFTLVYRVIGNVRIADGQDILYWQVIPEEHEYEIAQANIEIRFPASLQPVTAPRLEGAAAAAPQVGQGKVTWQVTGIPADQALSARVAFPAGSLIDRPPAWQAESLARGGELRAALPYALGIIALAAVLTAWWVLTQRRREAERQPLSFPMAAVTAPPDELTPAQAGFLVRGLSAHVGDGVATLLWLAEKGVIRLREEGRRGFLTRTDYRIELVDPAAPLKPHEAEALELLFPGRREPEKPVYLSAIGVPLSRQWQQISRLLQQEMDTLGLFDETEAQHKRRVQTLATVLLAAALAAGILGFLLIAIRANLVFEGVLLLAAAVGLLVFVMAAFIASSGWAATTPAGAHRRRRWVSFRDYLKEEARTDHWVEPEHLNRNLPYAVAFDLGDAWTGKYQKQGVDTALPWLLTVNGEMGRVSNMVTAISVISSAGDGGASSGAGAGGGGGGASGAG